MNGYPKEALQNFVPHRQYRLAYDYSRYFVICSVCREVKKWDEMVDEIMYCDPETHILCHSAKCQGKRVYILVPEREEEVFAENRPDRKHYLYTDEFDSLEPEQQKIAYQKISEQANYILDEWHLYFQRLRDPRHLDPKHPMCANCGSFDVRYISEFEKTLRYWKRDILHYRNELHCNNCGAEWNIHPPFVRYTYRNIR